MTLIFGSPAICSIKPTKSLKHSSFFESITTLFEATKIKNK
ncbi:hypothetical protein QUF74_10500 [Candidatus Halobeggiatoa sp. HSG11]|nr:hypothetical protein [Candidatus Halobeggiatoa sp. HSG11]